MTEAEKATELPPAPRRLHLDTIGVRFGGIAALHDVNLDVAAGTIHGLIGPNGAGKTTLFDVIAGLRAPTSGRVVLDGVDVTSRPAVWRSRNGIRRTFQRQQPFGWLSVEDNLIAATDWRTSRTQGVADMVGLRSARQRDRERREFARTVLEECGVLELADRPASSLAIGQARMVELGRAVMDPPALLLLDEPTSGLEDEQAEKLAEIVRAVVERSGCAVLIVEHDVPFIMNLCDSISVLDLGQVIAEGPPSRISTDPKVRAVYLG